MDRTTYHFLQNMRLERDKKSMLEKYASAKSAQSLKPDFDKQAVWSGYQQSYIRNIIKGADKALTLLATLTFDPGLLFWVRGLANYLDGKIKESDAEIARLKRIEQGKPAHW